MIEFVVGVATTTENVVLIKKIKPEWQAGKYNFVGGKLEPNEKPVDAMVREFVEETGVMTVASDWEYVGKMQRPGDFICYIFSAENEAFQNCYTTTEEEIVIKNKEDFLTDTRWHPERYMSNLSWVFLFTKSNDFHKYNCKIELKFSKDEKHELS